ncbi:MAG: FAD-binding oxidoreductase [Acidobacteria bacterium]|nr:FAD-binding oxidoreductase [Acidobacteriota bacterium]
MNGTKAVPAAAIAELRTQTRGELFAPGDPGYDEARSLWNAMHDLRPALVVRCADAADAVTAVNFARGLEIPVAVRGGGHNVSGSGSCDGGIQLDLSRLNRIDVNPTERTADVEAGATWGEFDQAAQAHGLATTGGICSRAGVADVTLGGGFGWLMRKHGLALDNMLSANVVTADGRMRTASPTENPDLYFGLRGSQSNLGIVTSFRYQLHPVGPLVVAGMVLHPIERGREVLRFYRDYTAAAADELSAWAAMLTSPDGHKMIAILACHVGPVEAGRGAVEPLRTFGPPVMDMIQPMPYVNAQSMIDQSFPSGRFNHWRSHLLSALGDELIDRLVDGFAAFASPFSSVLIEHLGGAMGRVPAGQTAFPHRSANYDVVIMPMWTDAAGSESHLRWADALWSAIQPFSTGGIYVNYLGDEGEEGVRAAYGSNYSRLAALKDKYDPGNLFRFNQNIKPNR